MTSFSRLDITDICFSYDEKPTLTDVSLSVTSGELFGLLGPNGAGKTTLVTLIAGLLKPAAGTVSVASHALDTEPLKARSHLGLVFQSISLDRFMSVEENLIFASGLQGLSREKTMMRVAQLATSLKLTAFLKRPVFSLSGGQQRLVDIARAMMHEPALLVLDEPTHGLDVVARQQVWSVLDQLRRQADGPAVLVTTHLMDEAAACDRVCFLKQGQLLWTGTPAEALEQLPEREVPASSIAARSLADWFVWRAGQ